MYSDNDFKMYSLHNLLTSAGLAGVSATKQGYLDMQTAAYTPTLVTDGSVTVQCRSAKDIKVCPLPLITK